MSRLVKLLLFILVCLPISCCFIVRRPGLTQEPKISVAVLWNTDTIFAASKNPYSIVSQGRATSIKANTSVMIIFWRDSIIALKSGKEKIASSADNLTFESPDDISVGYNVKDRTPYHNRIVIKKNVIHRFTTTKNLTVINILPIEKYLYGVVSCEIGMAKELEIEAVKAQAVAARSYTMTLLGKRNDFDLYGSYLYDQEYKGLSREYKLAIQAVNETRGEIMQYKEEPILAQYHACCGGRTTNGRYSYLQSIIDAPHHAGREKPFCKDSPYFEWNVKLGQKIFQDTILKLAGIKYKFSFTPKLEINKNTKRVEYLKFNAEKEYQLPGETVRKALNLRSVYFELKIKNDSVEILGHGWGHGIGLCQYGALEMARQKISYKNILKHYYSNIKISQIY